MERANVIFIAAAIYARTHSKHTHTHTEADTKYRLERCDIVRLCATCRFFLAPFETLSYFMCKKNEPRIRTKDKNGNVFIRRTINGIEQ